MSEGEKKPMVVRDGPVEEVDRTLIRRLLTLTPAERFRIAVEEARNVAKFDDVFRRARRR
jgi:hypothetical protein